MPIPAASVTSETFRKACSKFATGIAIATVIAKSGEPYGITVNSFTSVSCVPPLILICIDYRSSILPHFRSTSFFGINVLEESQRQFSVRFSQRELDRFEGIDWTSRQTGVPLLPGVLAQLECCVTQTVEAGDHAIFLAEVVSAAYRDGNPLLYFGSDYGRCAT
jgi:3-hydroxy-9,10-secoandrosta-1,3,5(10)-triene-9,17-dione monooxygenase reductase component